MMITSAREFVEVLLRDEVPSADGLLAFLTSKGSNEGLLLDFKHADELLKPKDQRNFTLRQYVAAFANSEGGVLAIGIQDKTKTLPPITETHQGRVGGDLKGWAARTVGDLTGALGAPPRFATVDVPGGVVLLVAMARAPSLVSISKAGEAAYYFRIEDAAREVPASLVADLVLGRRQRPVLAVEQTSGARDAADERRRSNRADDRPRPWATTQGGDGRPARGELTAAGG